MDSHHLLSPNGFFYITSQKDKLSTYFNKSQELIRIKKEVGKAFKTFELILQSDELSQDQKDEMFSNRKIRDMLMDLIKYDSLESLVESRNKLSMAQSCLESGLEYFERRYSKVAFYHDKINEFKSMINALYMLADQEAHEEEDLTFYKVRGKMKLPPTIEQHQTEHTAMCRICWNHNSEHGKDEAIKGIRHKKHCPYDKNDLNRCIEDIPPKIPYFN